MLCGTECSVQVSEAMVAMVSTRTRWLPRRSDSCKYIDGYILLRRINGTGVDADHLHVCFCIDLNQTGERQELSTRIRDESPAP